MHIAGVVVNALPERQPRVEQLLLQLAGVEIHAVAQGRMVITIEGDDEGRVADLVTQMHSLEGVLSASMVYHNFDPSNNEEEASS